ncbi:MAG: ABC transporter ATP-binding protein [Desulfurococcales archaeon]|nr:ABC transporter ATP-binding protein [Desulfurococcales archaeon]
MLGSIVQASIVEVRNVWMIFGATVALKDVSLSFGKGLHFIVGPNGSGKTTLLKIVSGIVKPSRGKVSINGVDPAGRALLHKPLVGGVLGDESPPFWMRSGEYLEEVANLSKCSKACMERIYGQAERLGVSSYLDKMIVNLSTGMRKKLIILAAIAFDAPVLVFDEPFSGLDKRSIDIVSSILQEESKEKVVLVATHIVPPDILNIDSITVILNGVVKTHLESSLVSKITLPVVKTKVLSKDKLMLPSDIAYLNPDKLELIGGEMWALFDGPSYTRCLERGLCSKDYTIDVDTLLSLAYSM